MNPTSADTIAGLAFLAFALATLGFLVVLVAALSAWTARLIGRGYGPRPADGPACRRGAIGSIPCNAACWVVGGEYAGSVVVVCWPDAMRGGRYWVEFGGEGSEGKSFGSVGGWHLELVEAVKGPGPEAGWG